MQKLFNKILVPVDFSARPMTVIEKAIEVAREHKCSIQLLHVAVLSPFASLPAADGHRTTPPVMISNMVELEFQLKKYCRYISTITDNYVPADFTILVGSWDEAIIDFVNNNRIDLVLIGQKRGTYNKRKMLLNPDKIAAKTNIPVITIPYNRRISRLLSIVIPITDFLPVRKLMYGVYLSSSNNTSIKLLAVENDKTRDHVHYYLKKAFQLICDNCSLKVELETITGNNIAEAVQEFARMKSVDLVIVNPETQTRMPGILSSLRGKILQKYSAMPVLTVNAV